MAQPVDLLQKYVQEISQAVLAQLLLAAAVNDPAIAASIFPEAKTAIEAKKDKLAKNTEFSESLNEEVRKASVPNSTTFQLFNQFPPEIRCMVWKAALPKSRVIKVSLAHNGLFDHKDLRSHFISNQGLPVGLGINQESRVESPKHYQLAFPTAQGGQALVLANFSKDIICFGAHDDELADRLINPTLLPSPNRILSEFFNGERYSTNGIHYTTNRSDWIAAGLGAILWSSDFVKIHRLSVSHDEFLFLLKYHVELRKFQSLREVFVHTEIACKRLQTNQENGRAYMQRTRAMRQPMKLLLSQR